MSCLDKLFWVAMRRLWPGWKNSLIVVTPATVVRWHRAGFRLYWAWLSRTRRVGGRRPLTKELRDLIYRIGRGEPDLGSVTHSRRVAQERIRHLGANGFSMGEAGDP
jgi:hypothetical protein